MSKVVKMIGGLSMVAGLALAGTAVANADRGDGLLSCNSGEICFAEHSGGGGGQRHFWYGSSSHANEGNFSSGTRFYHNASSIKNRDTSSNVCVTESGDWVNDSWQFPSRSTTWSNFANDLNDENAKHYRGNC